MTLDEYKAKAAASETIPKLELRQVNDGESEVFKGAKQLTKDPDADNYFVGKVRCARRLYIQITHISYSKPSPLVHPVPARRPSSTSSLTLASSLLPEADEAVAVVSEVATAVKEGQVQTAPLVAAETNSKGQSMSMTRPPSRPSEVAERTNNGCTPCRRAFGFGFRASHIHHPPFHIAPSRLVGVLQQSQSKKPERSCGDLPFDTSPVCSYAMYARLTQSMQAVRGCCEN